MSFSILLLLCRHWATSPLQSAFILCNHQYGSHDTDSSLFVICHSVTEQKRHWIHSRLRDESCKTKNKSLKNMTSFTKARWKNSCLVIKVYSNVSTVFLMFLQLRQQLKDWKSFFSCPGSPFLHMSVSNCATTSFTLQWNKISSSRSSCPDGLVML